jgi:DNA-binding Xre family transcriptional regulator
MDFRDAFNETLEHYQIKALELSELSGLDPVQISKFRNKHKNMQTHNFQRLIEALPSAAKMYFWYLVMADDQASVPSAAEKGGTYKA